MPLRSRSAAAFLLHGAAGGRYNAAGMCGFAGEFIFVGKNRADPAVSQAMAARLKHRGPDEEGSYISQDGRCALGFRRLAVIDLPLSHQPMLAEDGWSVVVFNGEIYNFRCLREELARDGYAFRTQGDTEVLLALWQRHGEAMLDRLEGMFAFVLHDARQHKVFLARDRLGKKPLWYSALGDRIVFASEAKALLVHPAVSRDVDAEAVGFYLTMGYVPAPRSIWGRVRKLPPGHCLMVRSGLGEPRPYWLPPDRGRRVPRSEALESVRQTVLSAVSKRMVADVPLGALLSGGVDSSVVVALMCQAAGKSGGVKTFTAGFAEQAFDERPFAAAVARHLGTEHRELVIAPADAPALLDQLVEQYDEPFADSSALPLYLICRAAREHVTVALTGDGGDESFAGYERYRAMHLAQTMGATAWFLATASRPLLDRLAPQDERCRLRRLVRFASVLDEPPALQYFAFRRLFSPGQLQRILENDFAAAAGLDQPQQWFTGLYETAEFQDESAFAQRHDLLTYRPDDLLVKADIASMAHSLELRSPLLDHHVVTLGLGLPVEFKLRRGRGKAILREAFAHLLPRDVLARGKQGFGVPLDRWLGGQLLPSLRQTLLEGPLVKRGWMARGPLEQLINDHLAARADHRHRLWALLWLGRWLDKNP
jgi:asparagine synthase (glutamine-hydrolysing)